MSTANFYQFSWGRLDGFYWDYLNKKFDYIFELPPELWCSEVHKVLGNVEYKYRRYNEAKWLQILQESDKVTCGRYLKYALTCNDTWG